MANAQGRKPRTSVAPCGECGTDGGYRRTGRRWPERWDSSRYGGPGPVCVKCYNVFKSLAAGSRAAPAKDNPDAERAAYGAVRAGVLSRFAGYEADERDPLRGPFHAPETPRANMEAAAGKRAVGAMRAAWAAGDMGRLREAVFGRGEFTEDVA